jgi:hypothetical protein
MSDGMIPERFTLDTLDTHIKCRDPIPIEDENEINDCYSDMSKEARGGISIGNETWVYIVTQNTKKKFENSSHADRKKEVRKLVVVVKRNNTE